MILKNELNKPLRGQVQPQAKKRSITAPRAIAALSVAMLGGGFIIQSLQSQNSFRAIAPEPEPVIDLASNNIDRNLETGTTAPLTDGAFAGTSPLEPLAPFEGDDNRTLLPNGAAIIKVPPPANDGQITISDPSTAPSNPRFAHLPDNDLLEQYGEFRLPRRGPDGNRPFEVYARTWSGNNGPRVAILIGGLGLSQTGTKQAIEKLPPNVTLGFAATGNSLNRWMQEARREGHEVMLQIPMEPYNYPANNPGLGTLQINASADENIAKLRRSLGKMTNYTGIVNFMGGRMTADSRALQPIMEELTTRGLMYLDDGSSSRSMAAQVANASSTPFAGADIVIDAQRNKGQILKSLNELERLARGKGYAIGTGSSFDVTIDAVNLWIAAARKRGIDVVPITALATDPESLPR